jgi:hypothetical protein
LGKLAQMFRIIPLKEDDDFIRISGVAQEHSTLGTAGLACRTMLIKNGLPFRIISDFMSDK